MNLLALDTSSLACSTAVLLGDAVIERHEEKPREHTRIIMPMISEVLDEAGIGIEALDAIVLGNGPGSFIGLRIAASIAQGLAYGAGIGIVPVSSLAAVAAQVVSEEGATKVAVCQDAHMNEVYLGLYRAGAGGRAVAITPERLHGQGIVDDLQGGGFVAAGFGWHRYPALLAANEAMLAGIAAVVHPRARYLLPDGMALFESRGSIAPQDVAPAYLRARVAQRADAAAP